MIFGPGEFGWLDTVKAFERTAFRLEQQPAYLDDVRAGMLNDWLAGATEPPGPNDWSRLIESKTAAGAEVVRIRVVEEPETPYQQWIRWYSHKNVRAGEQQHYLSRWQAPDDVTEGADLDFWLIDGETLVVFTFDDEGRQSVEVTLDAERIFTATNRFWLAKEWVTVNRLIDESGAATV